jgi:hypothetical protein
MKFKTAMISGLLIFSLAGCASNVGDFCDIYEPVTMQQDSAQAIVANDRSAAIAIATNQANFFRQCS